MKKESQKSELLLKEEEKSIDPVELGKKAHLSIPHQKVSKASLKKSSSLAKTIKGSLEQLLPSAVKSWILHRKIAKEVPLSLLREALLTLEEKNLKEIEFSSEEGESLLLSLKSIRNSLPYLSPLKFQAILSQVQESKNIEFKEEFFGKSLYCSGVSKEDLLKMKGWEVALVLYQLPEEEELLNEFSRDFPKSLREQVLPLLLPDKRWQVFVWMEGEALLQVAPFFSEEMIEKLVAQEVEEEKLQIFIPTLSKPQLQSLMCTVIEYNQEDKEGITKLLVKFLDKMTPEQVAQSVAYLPTPQKRRLLGHYWHRPLGITTAVANRKMRLFQIAAALTNPELSGDLLNAVEWMDAEQLRVSREMLLEVSSQAKRLVATFGNKLLSERNFDEEQAILFHCCQEIQKLKNQKYHTLHQEIQKVAQAFSQIS